MMIIIPMLIQVEAWYAVYRFAELNGMVDKVMVRISERMAAKAVRART